MGNQKVIYALRHAEAESGQSGPDKARKLTKRGSGDAYSLGRAKAERGYMPSFALCSPATRTRETLQGLCETLKISHVEYPESLYDGSAGALFEWVKNVEDRYDSLMLVGHNPGIHNLVSVLTGPRLIETKSAHPILAGYPSGTLTVIRCPFENWKSAQPGMCDLIDTLTPQDYGASLASAS